MKRAKLLLSTLAMLVLVVVMAFAISACSGSCNDKDKDNNNNGFVEKNPSDLGINDSSDNTKALQSIAVSGGKSKFALGEDFSKGGLSVTATYIDLTVEVTEDNPNANLKTETLQESDYTVDSAAFNKGKVGTYKINVSYTHAGVTRSASYDAEVGAVEPGYGGILVERNNTETYTLSADLTSKTLGLGDVTVYERSSEDGTVDKAEAQPVAAENLDAKLYLGTQAVENNEAKLDGVYTLVVSLKSDPSKYDFVNFTVANPVKTVEFIGDAEGTLIEQNRNVTDEITSTWNFKLTYVNGVYENVKLADGGFTTDFNPLTSNAETAKQTVNVTYAQTDALGAKHTATCTVANVNVKPNTETLVIEREYIARDDSRYEKDGTIDGALIPGDTILMSTGDKVKFGETTTTYSDGSNFGKQRIQLSDKRLITIMVHGVTKISLYFSSDNNTLKVYGPNDTTTEVFSKQVKRSDNKAEGPVTFVLSTPGLYTIMPTSTTNMHAIYLTTLIPVEGQTIGSYTVKFNENFGTEPTVKEEIVLGFEGFNTPAGYTPERTGYTFEGWFTAAEGGDKVDLSEQVITDNTKIYYAHWSENEVEAIKASKTQTEYLLVNGDVEIKTNDVTVKDSNDKDLSENWSVISKELYSDEECATKVTGNKATALGTYYLKVTAQYKEDTAKQLSSIIEITVSDFDNNDLDGTTKNVNLDKTTNKFELTEETIAGLVKGMTLKKGTSTTAVKADDKIALSPDGPWSATYEFKTAENEDVSKTSTTWTIEEVGTYTLTITLAKTGHDNVVITVTYEVAEATNVATGSISFKETNSNLATFDAKFGTNGSTTKTADITSNKEFLKDEHVTVTILATAHEKTEGSFDQQVSVDNSKSATINDVKYYGQIKFNGTGSKNYRSLKLEFGEKVKSAKIYFYGVTGSSGKARDVGVFNSTVDDSKDFKDSGNAGAKVVSTTVNTAGEYTLSFNVTGDRTYYLGSMDSGINFYALTVEYKYTDDSIATPVTTTLDMATLYSEHASSGDYTLVEADKTILSTDDVTIEVPVGYVKNKDSNDAVPYILNTQAQHLFGDDDTNYTVRLKFGGKIDKGKVSATDSTKVVINGLKVTTTKACTISVYVRAGNRGTVGTMDLYTFADETLTNVTNNAANINMGADSNRTEDQNYIYKIDFQISGGGTYYIGSNQSCGIYALTVTC